MENHEDMFDSLLNVENDLIDAGYDEGFAVGTREGMFEGERVGLIKGIEVGEELGFYRGCLTVWKALHAQKKIEMTDRSLKGCARLEELIDNFVVDASRDTIAEEIENIRGKFKLLQTQLDAKGLQRMRVFSLDQPQGPTLKF